MRWASCVLVVAFAAAPAGCREEPGSPPSIVLITVDTLRADRLGCYGYFRDTTPNLDALARESLLFKRCSAPIATTFPSHLALLTGTHPLEHGAVANVANTGRPFVPTPDVRSLAQLLKDSGYRTRAAVSATPLKRHAGLYAGFERYDEPSGGERNATATNRVAMRWLAELKDAPFFLWIHFYDPHDSYRPPEPFRDLWTSGEEQERYLADRGFREVSSPYQAEESMRRLNDLYDGEVTYVDYEIGRLLSELRADPEVWERTAVVVVGDHGEGLGQHGEALHGGIWREQLHVPLLIRAPGTAARRVDGPLAISDVVPTLLDFVDLPCRDAFLRQASGADRGKSEGETYLLGQQSEARWKMTGGRTRALYVLTGKEWKLIHEPEGTDRLFRLADDPFELADRAADHPETVARLRGILRERLAAVAERASARRPPAVAIDPKIAEEMRALGYAN